MVPEITAAPKPIYQPPFSPITIRSLAWRGIVIIGRTYIPGDGDMPYANGEVAFCLDNNGEHQIRTFREVLKLAE